MKKILLLTIAFSIVFQGATAVLASSGECSNISTIFLRGSGQNGNRVEEKSAYFESGMSDNEAQTQAFFDELDKKITGQTKEFISFHNQGGHKYGYKAQGIESFTKKAEHNTVTTIRNNAYYESMYDGSDALTQYLKKKISSCPAQQIIIGGYSQGAQVVGEALPRLSEQERSKIKYTALYGDPKLNTKDNTSIWKKGPWVHGNTNRHVNGILGARLQYLPEDMRNKSGSWCDMGDPICAGRSIATNIVIKTLFDKFGDKTHSDIYQGKWIAASSNEIASKIEPDKFANKKPYLEQTLFFKNGTRPLTDIVLIVDNSGFMTNEMEYIRNNKTKIAESFLKDKPNTQVSIVRYGNQSIPFYSPSRVYADQFTMPTSSINKLADGLGNLHPMSNGDWETAVLDGLDAATKLEQKTGRAGAQKQFIVITKNKPASFDHLVLNQKITSSVIYKRMKELDPAIANIMVLPDASGSYSALPKLQNIATATNGQIVQANLSNMQSSFDEFVAILDTSPVVSISNVEYEGNDIYLTGGETYDPNSYITKYKWDCNDDGIWDIEDIQASAICHYESAYTGLVVLEVETFDGQSAKAIQSVSIQPTTQTTASLEAPVIEVNYANENSISVTNNYPVGTYFEVYDEDNDLIIDNGNSPLVHENFKITGSKYSIKAVNSSSESAFSEVAISPPIKEAIPPDEVTSPPKDVTIKEEAGNNAVVSEFNKLPTTIYANILAPVTEPSINQTISLVASSGAGINYPGVLNENGFSAVGNGSGNYTHNKPSETYKISGNTEVLGETNETELLLSTKNLMYLAAFLGIVFVILYLIRRSNQSTEKL